MFPGNSPTGKLRCSHLSTERDIKTHMGYTLCRYGLSQAENLARFVVPIASRTYAKWIEAAAAGEWAGVEHGVQAWTLRLEDPATHVLAFERPDASIAACAFVRISGEVAHFGGLYVEDVARGLGGRLRDERLRISLEAGAKTAVMRIRESNAPARALAEKAGFTIVEEDPCARLSAVRRLVYAKPLDVPVLVPA